MKRALLVTLVAISLLIPAIPATAEDLSSCGAVTLENRPPFSGKKGKWSHVAYQERHNQYLKEHPDVFASGYIAGRHFYVGFTEDVCAHLKAFKEGLPDKWRVKAFDANWSYRELRQAQKCVAPYFDNEWLNIQGTWTDVWRNKVGVMFERNTEKRRQYILKRCGTVNFRFEEGTVGPG